MQEPSALSILLLNMTVVFAVLIFLMFVIKITSAVVESFNRKEAPAPAPTPAPSPASQVAQSVGSAAASAEAQKKTEASKLNQVAAISAAISCYLDSQNYKIVSIRPLFTTKSWTQISQQEAVLNRQKILVGR
ncbi:MAG: Oxaloacetate decarboxylase, gamma chain [Clostridia bacterium]|nr:Oxaloacetate decarboxylase, gamma chain [Clostridia bacterium]